VDRRLRLRVALLATVAALATCIAGAASAAPTELYVSEYVEGSSNNKALELYNGTPSAITLTGSYDVQIFANASPTATATIPLTGTVASGDVFVLARTAAVAAILAAADQTTTNFLFSGDDAVALRKDGAILDVVGQIGVDPGAEWGTGDASTLDNTLRRKPSVEAGDANGADGFDPSAQWNGFPLDSFDGLGAHTFTGGGGGGGGGGGTNTAPDARDDAATVEEDADSTAVAVLANDLDPDGDTIAVSSVSGPAHGMVSVESGGVSYRPDVDFNGSDSFTYTVSDGHGGSDTATVDLTVTAANDDPDLDDDAAATDEDVPVVVAVLSNDLDVDGDSLMVTAADDASDGTTTISPDGTSVIYSPDRDFHGTDGFEYTVSDGRGGSESAEVMVTVAAVNDPPVAQNDAATVSQGDAVVIDVLANDRPGPAGESGPPLQVASVGTPAHGTAELLTSGPDAGKVRYTPSSAFRGADSFTYVVSDGSLTATGTVDVQVTQPSFRTLCGLTPTIVGTQGSDIITGTAGDDVIRGRRGNDVIDGNGGNDIICAGPGADRVTTGSGDDRIAGGSGEDTVDGGGGHDRMRGGFGRDTIAGKAGNDQIASGPGGDTVDAGDGDNRVSAGDGDDAVTAGSGNDRIDGGPGTDSCDADGGRNSVARCES
jgi:Ca2+-binding RTX toxin-like protein